MSRPFGRSLARRFDYALAVALRVGLFRAAVCPPGDGRPASDGEAAAGRAAGRRRGRPLRHPARTRALESADGPARATWQKWIMRHPSAAYRDDAAYPPPENLEESDALPDGESAPHNQYHDTVGVLAIDERGQMAGACSTSGLPFKVPGRVGDSPIIGQGLYVDPRRGAAVCTGVGELVMGVCGSFLAVESMGRGASPGAAARAVLERILEKLRAPRKTAGGGHRPPPVRPVERGRVAAGLSNGLADRRSRRIGSARLRDAALTRAGTLRRTCGQRKSASYSALLLSQSSSAERSVSTVVLASALFPGRRGCRWRCG